MPRNPVSTDRRRGEGCNSPLRNHFLLKEYTSVITTADEHLNAARESLNNLITNLSKILVDKCEGSNDYNKDLLNALHESFVSLLEIRRRIS
jgi:hypothetical protein